MSKVVADVSISPDGYATGPNDGPGCSAIAFEGGALSVSMPTAPVSTGTSINAPMKPVSTNFTAGYLPGFVPSPTAADVKGRSVAKPQNVP